LGGLDVKPVGIRASFSVMEFLPWYVHFLLPIYPEIHGNPIYPKKAD